VSVLPSGRGADVEFRILGPLEVLENGHQVVRHRTRALRARPARLARFIEEQRAPPGSTTFAPGRPAAHLGKFGDRVRGNSPDRPHAGETPLLGKGAVLAHRFDRPLAAESDEEEKSSRVGSSLPQPRELDTPAGDPCERGRRLPAALGWGRYGSSSTIRRPSSRAEGARFRSPGR
jgi:hypothetical protein